MVYIFKNHVLFELMLMNGFLSNKQCSLVFQ
jgi:hypothetical protein